MVIFRQVSGKVRRAAKPPAGRAEANLEVLGSDTKSNTETRFSSGLELANLLASSDVIHYSLDAISKTVPTDQALASPVVYEVHEYPSSGCNVIAFVSSPSYVAESSLEGDGKDLISSQDLKEVDFSFLSTQVNPSFSINKAAITTFASLQNQLSSLKDQINLSKPLIITGHSLAGSIASLFTLWLQHSIDQETGPRKMKRPICITFGSPLIGDDRFRKAILERPTWTSCFLHVVSNQDPIPRLFVPPHNALVSEDSHGYNPFGTYLFCSESGGGACFDEHESILGLMAAMRLGSVENRQINDYERVVRALKEKAGIALQLGEFNFNSLKAGIALQLAGIGVQENIGTNATPIEEIVARQAKCIRSKRSVNVYEPTKALNDMKISLTFMEWFMKVGLLRGGYYESYKNPKTIREIEGLQGLIVVHHRKLVQYWKKEVEEKDKMPQKEGAPLRVRWLFGGTNYRRIVEPLDIADYYHKENKRNYLTQGRSEHYKLLEKWLNEDKKDKNKSEKRVKAVSLTEDSCFWAHVEEAIISCKALKDGETRQEDSLVAFETYVMDLIDKLAVSPEIFLEQSSCMQWWKEYHAMKGTSNNSPLAKYMRVERYRKYA